MSDNKIHLPTTAELEATADTIRIPIDLHPRIIDTTLQTIAATWPHDTLHTADGQPYMRRYYPQGPGTPTLGDTSIRLHHFLNSDPGRDLHDHPWDFTTTILNGTYIEHTPTGPIPRHTGDTIHHQAEHPHRIELTDGPVWTLFTHGPARRRWGFHTPTGWTHWTRHPNAGYTQ